MGPTEEKWPAQSRPLYSSFLCFCVQHVPFAKLTKFHEFQLDFDDFILVAVIIAAFALLTVKFNEVIL